MLIKQLSSFLFGLILVLHGKLLVAQDSIYISEFMAINTSFLQDEDGDYSDWIEIYNSGSEEINLNGWSLTDDATNLLKWTFPNIVISAKEYILIYASNKNRKLEKDKLHTNFKLSGAGEYLALVNPVGILIPPVFSPAYPEQFSNISYGVNSESFTYFANPTPGAENTGDSYILPPKFSVQHGFFQEAFTLELLSQNVNADIYYTTDASAPDKLNGIKYSHPINITTTTIIRAFEAKEGVGESVSVTQSYIFPDDVVQQSENQEGYPTTWLSPIHGTDDYFEIPSNYSMKPEFIAKPEVSKVILQSLKSLPVVSIVSDIDNFFSKSTDPDSGGIYMYNGEPDGPTRNMQYHLGRDWSRPASIEYFNSNINDGSFNFQANCIVKIHGGASRTRAKTEKHSLKIGFKSEFGPSKLQHQLFGKGSPKQFDWLVLRGGFAPRLGLQVKDPWAKTTMREMGQYAAYSKFVHVYINGLYWGMYNLSEQMDENCMRDNLGGNSDDYDIIKDYHEVESGDTIAWDKLAAIAAEDPVSNPGNYQKLLGNNPDGTPNPDYEKLINPENLIDYIMMNMFAGTGDWDYHNYAAARRKTNSEGFHFLVWDAEGVFTSDNISAILSGGTEIRPTGIFSDLIKYEQFQNIFISRVNKHFFEEGALTPAPSLTRYKTWLDVIDTALISDQARWVWSDDIWNKEFHSFIYDYFPPRTESVFKQFISEGLYPNISAPVFNTSKRTIPKEFQLLMESPGGGEIYYTFDGSDPGHFKLSNTPSIKIYDNTAIAFEDDTITINARVKQDTLWSKLVTKKFYISNFGTSFTANLQLQNDNLTIYPNPVKESAQIVFSVVYPSDISIKIYNMLGIEVENVINEFKPTGEYEATWYAGNFHSGVYFCVLENRTNGTSNRITLIKE